MSELAIWVKLLKDANADCDKGVWPSDESIAVSWGGCRIAELEQERDQLKHTVDALRDYLQTYRDKVPLGHQPHMLAHKVDEYLKALRDKEGE
jgi:hypothetical protein